MTVLYHTVELQGGYRHSEAEKCQVPARITVATAMSVYTQTWQWS